MNWEKRWLLYPLLVWWMTTSSLAQDERVFSVRLNQQNVERLKRQHAYLMSIAEEELIGLVPVQSGIWYTDCPHCDGATQDRGNWNWDPRDPQRITCRDCGQVYPGNERYPETGEVKVAAPEGQHVYPYWQRPGDNYRVYFQASVDAMARRHMDQACRDLARLYVATGDEAFARRAALILLRFAEVYPGYALKYDYPFRAKEFWPFDAQNIRHQVIRSSPDRLSKYDWWRYVEIGQALVEAYDILRFWAPLRKMDSGHAMERIEHDLLGAMVEFALDYPDQLTNMGPTNWRRVIDAGRVLGRPEFVHEAVDRFERFLTTQFLYDGHWKETSPSYHAQCLGGIQAIRASLNGYADPPDYKHPGTDKRLDAETLQPIFSRYERSLEALTRPRLPDGRLLPVNDTWWTGSRGTRSRMEADLLPGLGVAVMGGGERNRQLHVHLNFSSGRGHKHRDSLSFGLFAHGKELFPDIGYTHTAWRDFVNSTVSHNTVVVNGVEQAYDPDWSGNRLRTFFSDGNSFHVSEAESTSAYPGLNRYRRTLMVVGNDSTDAYVLDVFQIVGGNQHDYLLHGSADDDSSATVDGVEMLPFDGTLMNAGARFREPRGENETLGEAGAFGFVRKLTRGKSQDRLTLDIRLTSDASIGTRTWLDAGDQFEVYMGEAPSIRRARSTDRDLPRYQAPFFSARRSGENLSSTFVAIHEPVRGTPRIQDVAVQRLADAVLVKVTTPQGTDYAIVSQNGESKAEWPTEVGPAVFQGRFGLVRIHENQELREAHLLGGTELRVGQHLVAPAPVVKGSILRAEPVSIGTSFGLLEVDQTLPNSITGGNVIVHHPDGSTQAYRVNEIQPVEAGTRIFTAEDAGFAYTDNGIETITFPRRRIRGDTSRFEILLHQALRPSNDPEP